MTSFFSKIICLAILSAVLFSCGGDDPTPNAPVDVTFLKVGTKQTFFYNDQVFNVDTLRLLIEKQLATDTFLVRYSSETITVAATQYWALKDNNLYMSIRLRDPSTYKLECKFGAPVGTSWNVTKSGVTYTYSIEALNVSITTGDGVVTDGVKVKIHSPSGQDLFQYYSPSVGMLGTGSIDETTQNKLVHYTIGTTPNVEGKTPAISFGNFPFLAVGKYWNYSESSFFGDPIAVELLLESKEASRNVYKAKLTYAGDISYSYWFEDNGMLMVYEEGETVLNADPIYMNESIATLGYGWASLTGNNTMYIYTISSLNETVDTFFGSLSCMGIDVSNGLFSTQTNYWNKNKGNALVSGFVTREVTSSNARKKNSGILYGPLMAF